MKQRLDNIGIIEIDIRPRHTRFVRLRCIIGGLIIKFGAFVINGRENDV